MVLVLQLLKEVIKVDMVTPHHTMVVVAVVLVVLVNLDPTVLLEVGVERLLKLLDSMVMI
tara:strand:- start:343 stop:522 length:180 start_codon:yes stop_codon:yes gene_type:complete